MESLLILLLVYLVGVLLIFPIWVLVRLRSLGSENESVVQQLRSLEEEIRRMRAEQKAPVPPPAEIAKVAPTTPNIIAPATATQPVPAPKAVTAAPLVPAPPAVAAAVPPPLPATQATRPVNPPPVYVPPAPPRAAINWEMFMGAKLFAWLGGFALFLGVAFFVKYSFDHDLIPPEVRVAIGFAIGAGLVVGGLRLTARYRIVAQALIATGVVSLYAVTFACNSVYHFAFFGLIPTFLLMALITAAAFVLAVRLRAQIVALLGILGGFLTPVLLSTGQDNPAGLFGYLALLDLGLIAVAIRTRWVHLVPIAATGTVLMMTGWADKFYTVAKTPTAMVVCLVFSILYLVAAEWARRRDVIDRCFSWTATALPIVGFAFGLYFLGFREASVNAPRFIGFVLALDALLIALAWRDQLVSRAHFIGGMASFVLLGAWTLNRLEDATLHWALAGYLAFAILHTVFPELLQRKRPDASPAWWNQLFAPLAVLLLLLPIYELGQVSLLIWPAILLVDLIAIGIAIASGSLVGVAAVLVLTLAATGLSILKIPAGSLADPTLLAVLAITAVFFGGATLWLGRKFADRFTADPNNRLAAIFGDVRAQLPAFSSLLPFLLLVLICARLAIPDPSMVFGLGLLLVVMTLGLAVLMSLSWLPLCALAGIAAVEFAWHKQHFSSDNAALPMFWYLGFHAIFTLFPFLFRQRFVDHTGPWATAALSGFVHFPLVYRLINQAAPNDTMGILPAIFAVPPLLSLVAVVKATPAGPARLNQLAWFGGMALFFITLVFPIQFERQWITIGWALEGAALLWLYHRVPHPALRGLGTALLVVCFVRLALNPAVLDYHPRAATPIWNWYLYSYGLVTIALAAGARLLAPPRERVFGVNFPPILNALAVVLAFFLLNIEIADFFTRPGESTLTFKFRGNFARDMTYTIAWALFALALLGAGIWRQQKAARYAAIGLLSSTLLKLFFHDLAHLAQLYRIVALFAVAVIAILASFAYQRFLPSHEKASPPAS